MDQSVERWLPVVGCEGAYEVSDQGRVRSLDRTVVTATGVVRNYKGKILNPQPAGRKEKRLKVTISIDGYQSPQYIHLLVLGAFVGPRPDGTEACHNNCNPCDNRHVNLRWDTRASNQNDQRFFNACLAYALTTLTAMLLIRCRKVKKN
jgi:hypothetical protein